MNSSVLRQAKFRLPDSVVTLQGRIELYLSTQIKPQQVQLASDSHKDKTLILLLPCNGRAKYYATLQTKVITQHLLGGRMEQKN